MFYSKNKNWHIFKTIPYSSKVKLINFKSTPGNRDGKYWVFSLKFKIREFPKQTFLQNSKRKLSRRSPRKSGWRKFCFNLEIADVKLQARNFIEMKFDISYSG